MAPPKVIALYSPAPQSGKSTIANILVDEYGYTRVSFAQTLKEMLKPLLRAMAVPEDCVEKCINDGEWKERTIPNFGISPRRLMQTLGTEWGRQTIGDWVWTRIARLEITRLLTNKEKVVVDDLRFLNEYTMLREQRSVHLIKVVRPGIEPKLTTCHISEGGLETAKFDSTWVNGGTLEDLEVKVRSFVMEKTK